MGVVGGESGGKEGFWRGGESGETSQKDDLRPNSPRKKVWESSDLPFLFSQRDLQKIKITGGFFFSCCCECSKKKKNSCSPMGDQAHLSSVPDDDAFVKVSEAARKALLASIPPPENYPDAKQDLVAGLQKRDFKYATAISAQLLDELGGAILPTKIVPLSFEEARSLYEESVYRGTFNPSTPILGGVIEKVDRAISQLSSQTEGDTPLEGIFCKLSFMSPKDVVLQSSNEKTQLALSQKVAALWSRSTFWERAFVLSSSHPEAKRLFLASLYSSLKVKCGLDAIGTICNSRRCFEELSDALIDENYFHTNIILRPWMTLRPGFEFRIYVSNGQITAGSQYESVYYKEVWEARGRLCESIGEFVRGSVIPRIRHRLPSVVIDIVMTSNGSLYVCELNPFAASSSACLFSWSEDKDQLLAGKEEWRFVSPQNVNNKTTNVPEEWAHVIDSHFAKKRTKAFYIPVAVLVVALSWAAYFGFRR